MENGFIAVRNNLIYTKELFDDRNSEMNKERTEILSPDEAIKRTGDPVIERFIKKVTTEVKDTAVFKRLADFICILTIEKDEKNELRLIYPLIKDNVTAKGTLYTQCANFLAKSDLYTKGDYAIFINPCNDVEVFNCSNSVTYRFEEDYNDVDPESLVIAFPESQPQPTGLDIR